MNTRPIWGSNDEANMLASWSNAWCFALGSGKSASDAKDAADTAQANWMRNWHAAQEGAHAAD